MSWVLFAILATVIWAIVNIVDKYILTKWVKKPIIPVMIFGMIGLFVAFVIYLIRGFSELSSPHILLALIMGALYAWLMLLYFKAVKIEEISRVIPLMHLRFIFLLILASIFLGEVFTFGKYVGVFLLILGAILISSKNLFDISIGKVFWIMIFYSLITSINWVILKYLLNFADFWTIFSYARFGTFIALLPTFYLNFKDLVSTVKKHGKKVIYVISLNESLNMVGVFLIIVATSIGYVTLVSSLTAIQPFFVLLFAVILSIFYPRILKEEIKGSALLLKFTAIALMVIGTIIIVQ